jgi:LysM repeat protein
MGLISFVKEAGRKLGIGDEEPKKEAQARPAGGPSPEQVRQAADRRRGMTLANLVRDMGLNVENFEVRVDGDKATVSGRVPSQEAREKIVLLVGNTQGIGSVDDRLQVDKPEPEAEYYEVKSGDSLSKIAKQQYGDASKYPLIFEANRPMLKDPDEIYPGQKLRIPALETAHR